MTKQIKIAYMDWQSDVLNNIIIQMKYLDTPFWEAFIKKMPSNEDMEAEVIKLIIECSKAINHQAEEYQKNIKE